MLHGHGFGGSRETGPTGRIDRLRDAGYGVVSIDQRGHGESGGRIRVMDPDFEGRDLVAVLDWAERELDWLAYRDGEDGEPNPVVGAIGGSYGGGYQLLLHAIDPRRRLDAIVPEIAWHDLVRSLRPGGALKTAWSLILFGAGNAAGGGFRFDPFVTNVFLQAIVGNELSPPGIDFFRYHGLGYFCGGEPVATNGGPGTAPDHPPRHPEAIAAMFFQGFRDTLFDFNEAWRNAECLRRAGGDVRLLTYQTGHNAVGVVPDPGVLFQPSGNAQDERCGDLSVADATMAFFAEHLKGESGAADAVIPRRTCLSLTRGDAVLVDEVVVGTAGTARAVPATTVVTGLLDVPVAADLGVVAGPQGLVVGGIPSVDVTLSSLVDVAGLADDAIVFVGLGRQRASLPLVWDLVDNQVTPLRGLGRHVVELVGVAERLAPGDRLGLLVYGLHDQFALTGNLSLGSPLVAPVTVVGTVWLPLL